MRKPGNCGITSSTRTLSRNGLDFSTSKGTTPRPQPSATIHDANHLALTDAAVTARTAYFRFIVAPRARKAEALITVSDFSREQIARHLKLSPYRLQVIPNGVDAVFRAALPAELADFRARRGLPPQYFAAIGSIKPHKNLQILTTIAEDLPAKLVLLAGRGARRALGFPESVLELEELWVNLEIGRVLNFSSTLTSREPWATASLDR